MKIAKLLLMVALCSFVVAGCAPQRQYVQPVAVQVQFAEMKMVEGVTTKTEILQALGHPDKFGERSLSYIYYKRSSLEGAKIRYTQKDGTEFLIVLQKGTKASWMNIYLKDDGRLDHVSFG